MLYVVNSVVYICLLYLSSVMCVRLLNKELLKKKKKKKKKSSLVFAPFFAMSRDEVAG